MEKLFQYTYRNMKAVVAFYSVYSENIDDVLSELYFNVYCYAYTFDQEKNGYNWMTQIAKNLCTDYNSTQEIACGLDEDALLQANENERLIDYLFFEEAFRLLNESEKNYILCVYWHGFTVTKNKIAVKMYSMISLVLVVFSLRLLFPPLMRKKQRKRMIRFALPAVENGGRVFDSQRNLTKKRHVGGRKESTDIEFFSYGKSGCLENYIE